MKFYRPKPNSGLIKVFTIFVLLHVFTHSLGQDLPGTEHKWEFNNNAIKVSEKIYLHVDRKIYATGEEILFKGTYTNNIKKADFVFSKVLNVEIVDNLGHIISKNKYEINGNSVFGAIKIPTSLNSGNYILQSYTNWQKNFGAFFFFKKQITIINHSKDIYSGYKNDSIKEIKEVRFFPEGGRIIYNQDNLIAFKTYAVNGVQKNASGKLVDHNGNSICSVESKERGFGYFKFYPKKGYTYKLLIETRDGSENEHKLPTPVDSKYKIEFDNSNEQQILINIESRDGQCENCQLKIVLENNCLVYKVFEDEIYKGVCLIKIQKKELPEGINRLIIYDNNDSNIYERPFYNFLINQKKIVVKTNKLRYKKREKVTCEIITNDPVTDFSITNLSVSVTKKSISNFSTIFKILFNDGFDNFKLIDTYLLSLDYFNDTTYFHLPETRGISLRGKLINKKNSLLTNNRLVYLSTVGKPLIIQNARTNSNGIFIFLLNNLFGKRDFAVQLSGTEDISNYDIIIEKDSSFSQTIKGKVSLDLEDLLIYQNVVTAYLIHEKFRKNKSIDERKKNESTFYDKPDRVYLMKNYIEMPTMEELLSEIVDEVIIKKQEDNFEISVLRTRNSPLLQKPLILIDGLPIFNIKSLLEIKPSEIEKIELINTEYLLGDIVFGGIISFTSVNTDFAGFNIPKNAKFLELTLLSEQKPSNNKEYSSESIKARTPDYRNTLYWNPELRIDKDGNNKFSFYTSDESGAFIIDIKGLSPKEELLSTSCEFSVE